MSKEFSQMVGDSGRVYALDPDETGIALLREETKGTNIVALVGDITTTTQLPASAIDLIYLSTVFHSFSPEQIKGFEAEVKRLLAPRGKLAIVENCGDREARDPLRATTEYATLAGRPHARIATGSLGRRESGRILLHATLRESFGCMI
jgi:ubiquinone/menaquinone biosynthesis C-methylase UbiE